MNGEEDLKKLLKSAFRPTILVKTTPDVEKIMAKNGMKFIDLLRPCEVIKKDINIRTINEDYKISDFSVRFREFDDFMSPNSNEFKKFIFALVKSCYDSYEKPLSVPPDFEHGISEKLLRSISNTPWFEKFREDYLLNSIRLTPYECLSHPVACISVVSTESEDAFKDISNLFNPSKPPEEFKKNHVDQDILHYYVLVHDTTNTSIEKKKENSIFSKIQSTYGVSFSRKIYVNGRQEKDPQLPDIWSPLIPRYSSFKSNTLNSTQQKSTNIGSLLSKDDLSFLTIAVEGWITYGIIPFLEKKIKKINTEIVIPKKSFKSTFFSIFGKKKNSKEENSLSNESAEMQIRKMADYCFFLQDYETASATYKIAISDFKSISKDSIHATSALEALTWSWILSMSGSRKEIDSNFESCYKNYQNEKQQNLALRSSLIEAYVEMNRGNFLGATECYKRASSIDGQSKVTYALLFEQTAITYLYYPKPLFRKFALFMIFAGSRFLLAKSMSHSFRCYMYSILIYDGNWKDVNDHLNSTISQLSYFMKDLNVSVERIRKLLKNCTEEPEKQKAYLLDFIQYANEYYQSIQKSPNIVDLELPLFDEENVVVLLNNYGKPTSNVEMPNEDWRMMEESVVGFMEKKGVTFMWDKYYKPPKLHTVVKDEPIFVEVLVQNNLAIEIPIEKLQLTANFKPLTEDPEKKSINPYICETKNIILGPLEHQKILLQITPTEEGEIYITGIEWIISGSIRGTKVFKLKGRRKNETKQQRATISYEPDTRLNLMVISHQPLLDVSYNFPERLWNGEIKKLTLEFKNVGKEKMKNLAMKLSHPNFMCFATNDEIKEDFLGEDFNEDFKEIESQPNDKLSDNLSLLKIKDVLEPEETLSIPFFMRGTKTGIQNFKVLFYYETDEKKMPVRYFKLSKKVEVIDSIDITSFTLPCRKNVEEYIVGITVKSKIQERRIELDQITSISPKWKISPLNFDSSNKDLSKFIAFPQESTTLYLRISNLEHPIEVESLEEIDLSNGILDIHSMALPKLHHTGCSLASNTYRDTSASPFIDFLFRDCVVESGLSPKKDQIMRQYGLQRSRYIELTEDEIRKITTSLKHFPFGEKEGISLVFHWHTPGNLQIGQSHIIDLRFLPEKKIPISKHISERNKDGKIPLDISLKFPSRNVKHDFNENSICLLPVVITAENYSKNMECNFSLSLQSPSIKNETQNSFYNPYVWMGATKIHHEDFKPRDQIEYQVQVCFFSKGTYNVNQIYVDLYNKTIKKEQKFNFGSEQHLVTIE
eukprot:gene3978-7234_t